MATYYHFIATKQRKLCFFSEKHEYFCKNMVFFEKNMVISAKNRRTLHHSTS